MGIAYNTAVNHGSSTTSWTTSAHVMSAGANGLIVLALFHSQSDTYVSAVTYGGQALTRIAYSHYTFYGSEIWYLLAPPTGSNTFSITIGGGANVSAYSASYTGVKQSGVPDAYQTWQLASQTPGVFDYNSPSIACVAANDWLFEAISYGTYTSGTGANAGTVLATTGEYAIAHRGPVSGSSIIAVQTNYNGGASVAAAAFAFAPHVEGPAIPVLMNQYRQRRN